MTKKSLSVFSFLLIFILLFNGCGGASNNSHDKAESDIGWYPSYEEDVFETEFSDSNGYGYSSGSTDNVGIIVKNSNEKLVYTCRISLQTLDFSKTISSIKNLIAEYQGFVESESQYDQSDNWYYTDYQKTHATLAEDLVIRVPSDNYEEFVNGISGTGKVLSMKQDVLNITQSYNETSVTIQSLKTQEERLLEMMKDAKGIDEMLQIEARLSEVQNELAIHQTALNHMDTDIAYSTITLSIHEVMEYTPTIVTYTFGDRLANAFQNSWDNISSFLESTLFFIIEDLPVIVMILSILFILIFIVLKVIKKFIRRKDKSAPAASISANVIETKKTED